MPYQDDEMLTVAECARELRCGEKIVRKHIDLGNLKAKNLTPWSRYKRIKVLRNDFELFKRSSIEIEPKALALPTRTKQNRSTGSSSRSGVLDQYEARRGRW